jgi:hypothetical protein
VTCNAALVAGAKEDDVFGTASLPTRRKPSSDGALIERV